MKIEIDRIFNNRCLCFGIEFHWQTFLSIEIYLFSYNLTIIFKDSVPKFLQKVKSYSNNFNKITHWKSRSWWDR